MTSAITLLDITLLGVGVYLVKQYFSPKAPGPLPPGPKGLPVIGNAADMPTEEGWKTFTEWGKVYGTSLVFLRKRACRAIILCARRRYHVRQHSWATNRYPQQPNLSQQRLDQRCWSRPTNFMVYYLITRKFLRFGVLRGKRRWSSLIRFVLFSSSLCLHVLTRFFFFVGGPSPMIVLYKIHFF